MSTRPFSQPAILLEWLLRFGASIGLGASALLLWEYTSGAPRFCGAGEGCDLVRASRFASIFGLPTPVYGIVFFSLVLILGIVRTERARQALMLVGIAGGLNGIGLFLIQAYVVHAFCVYCSIVDTLMFVIAFIAVVRRGAQPALTRAGWVAFAGLFAVGFGTPFAYGLATHPWCRSGDCAGDDAAKNMPVPECVLAEQGADAVTIVEFFDFECPYCRAQHFEMGRLLAELSGKVGKPVRVVRKHYPLAAHTFAKGAARAAICAEEAGRGELMADLLFSADDLSPAALETDAANIGMDPAAYRTCIASEPTARRLADDEACGRAAHVEALPTFYIGSERFAGLRTEDVLTAAIRRAAGAGNSSGSSGANPRGDHAPSAGAAPKSGG
jgi:uncharacterized membrane protein/predicted DsbA family dithiol-disulfide isomerase